MSSKQGIDRPCEVVMVSASEMRTDARVCREAQSLAAAGYRVTIVCLQSTPPAHVAGVTLRELSASRAWRPMRLFATLIRVTTGVLTTRADVYHAHNVHVLPICWLIARRHKAKLVYDAHELFSVYAPRGRGGRPSLMQQLERRCEKLLAPKADLRLTASTRYATQIAESLGIDPPLAVPNYPPLPPRELRSPLRDRIGARDDEIVVLYQGGFYSSTRAIDVVIRAMELLPEHYRLVLLGFGTRQEEASLGSLIEELRLTSRVNVLPAVAHTELPSYTTGADIGVIPFRLETKDMQLCSPNKLYEYMAASIPVLASPAEELKEVLEYTGAGATYDYDDPADLAKAVQALGPQRQALRAIGERGRRAAEQRYSWEAVEHLLVDAYRALHAP